MLENYALYKLIHLLIVVLTAAGVHDLMGGGIIKADSIARGRWYT